jgi:hypothetical protein
VEGKVKQPNNIPSPILAYSETMQEMQYLEETDVTQLLQFIFGRKNMKTSMGEKHFGVIRQRIIAALRPLRWPLLNPSHKVVRILFHRHCTSKDASFYNEYLGLRRFFPSTRSQSGEL